MERAQRLAVRALSLARSGVDSDAAGRVLAASATGDAVAVELAAP